MRILAVCGMGIGTSIILKMNIEQALENLGISGEVEASDISAARGAAAGADVVLTSEELVEQLGEIDAPIAVINDFTNVEEIQAALADHI